MTSEEVLAQAPGFGDRRIGQPLWLAVLLSLAAFLTFSFFYVPGDVATLPHRFLANPFCQLIIATFVATLLYSLFQFLGLPVEGYHLRQRDSLDGTPPAAYTLRRFLSGREAYPQDRWLALLPHGLASPRLGTHLHTVLAQHHQQCLAPLQFSIWVMPMLGFIGTVVGIIQAIGGLEAALDRSGGEAGLATVLGGLSFAFDTTLLGLVLVIPLMIVQLLLRHRLAQQELHYRGLLLTGEHP